MGDNGLHPPVSVTARDARILVAITVHFNAARLEYLAEVMRSLAEFPVAVMTVILVTNTVHEAELAVLRRLCDEILPGQGASVRSYEYLAHPHYLTWRHRKMIASEFGGGAKGRYTHFIYLEDDIRLSFANFCYFVEFREVLRDAGLLPSFLRVEYSKDLNGFVNSDTKIPVDVSHQAQIEVGHIIMTNMPFPYNPCYILDAALAAEFLRTRSFKRESSRAVTDMEVRERAAMGLCYENVPEPFQCRYVVPISKTTGMALNRAWISHLPNNYANDPKSDFGKVRMDALFVNVGGSASRAQQGAVDEAGRTEAHATRGRAKRRRWSNIDFYLILPNKIIEGLRWRLGYKR
jgi:hypothetical protein